MLARELLRTSPDRVRAALAARCSDAPLERLLSADVSWREAQAELEALKADRNRGSKEVGALFASGRREEGEALRGRMAALGATMVLTVVSGLHYAWLASRRVGAPAANGHGT